jgi:hypothetical protein
VNSPRPMDHLMARDVTRALLKGASDEEIGRIMSFSYNKDEHIKIGRAMRLVMTEFKRVMETEP